MALRWRLAVVIFGIVTVAFVVTTSVQASSAEAKVSQEKQASAKRSALDIIGFDCIVPRFYSTQCGPQFYVGNGRTLRGQLRLSGGKRVDFTAYDVGTGAKLGNTRYLYPGGAHKALWTNRSGAKNLVYVRASSPANVRVQAIGHYDN